MQICVFRLIPYQFPSFLLHPGAPHRTVGICQSEPHARNPRWTGVCDRCAYWIFLQSYPGRNFFGDVSIFFSHQWHWYIFLWRDVCPGRCSFKSGEFRRTLFSTTILFAFCPVPSKKITTARRSRKSQKSAELSLASRGMVIYADCDFSALRNVNRDWRSACKT